MAEVYVTLPGIMIPQAVLNLRNHMEMLGRCLDLAETGTLVYWTGGSVTVL